MLKINNLTKIYNSPEGYIASLKNINFQVDQNDFVFLIGKSGAGKSTLIRLIIREELPTHGEIEFEGISISSLPKKFIPEYRRNIGIVFQDYKLLENKTVTENIEFVLEIFGKRKHVIKQTAGDLLDLVGLSNRSRLFPHQLSGGEKRRVVIARALANNPKLLIADEATGDLDPYNSEKIIELLEKINHMGTAIIMTTHDVSLVNKMQKRVALIEQGQIIQDRKRGSYTTGLELLEKKRQQFIYQLESNNLSSEIVDKLLNAGIDNIDLVINIPSRELQGLCSLSKKEYHNLLKCLENELS